MQGLDNILEEIFEVKIKEDKLTSIFESLQKRIRLNERKLQQLSIEVQRKSKLAQGPKQQLARTIENELRPLKQKCQEQQRCLSTIKYNHQNLCSNMGTQYKQFSAELTKYQDQVKEQMFEQNTKVKSQVQAYKEQIEQFQQQFRKRQREYQMKFDNVWDVIKEIRITIDSLDPYHKQLKKMVNFRKSQTNQNRQNGRQIVPFKPRVTLKKPMIRQQCSCVKEADRTIEFASLISRIEALQKKFEAFGDIRQTSKIMSSKMRIQSPYRNNEEQQEGSVSRIEKTWKSPRQSRFGRSSIRIDNREQEANPGRSEKQKQLINLQLKRHSDKINDLKYKYTLVQENYDMILNKIARVNQMEAGIHEKMLEVEKIRVDTVTINEINMRFRKIQSHLQEHQNKYVEQHLYSKEIKALKDHVNDIQLYHSRLARQDQVKQAFQFIQTKIKQIVLVLTDKFEGDKQGAINKIQQIKCLTCDKEIEQITANVRMSLGTSKSMRQTKSRNFRATAQRLRTEE